MQTVIQDFVVWFGRFVFCSTVILLIGHAAGRWMRRRKSERSAAAAMKQPGTAVPARGMKKLMPGN